MIRKQSRREWSDKMSDIQNERLIEFISNSKVAFINGQFQEAFTLAKEAIKLDENCADAYQCAANVCMSLGRYALIAKTREQLIRESQGSIFLHLKVNYRGMHL